MSIFAELKRRNVIRVGIAYVITAWLVAQIADLVLDNIESPAWVMQTLMLVLALGLPFALIFAWAFELTPEGIKKEKDVDRSKSITPKTGHALDRSIIVILVIALGYFVWQSQNGKGPEPATVGGRSAAESVEGSESVPVGGRSAAESVDAGTAPENIAKEKSIAVLPFVNMSDDASNEYFSDGISEEILNALAKVKELKVAGRTSSFAFKGQNEDLRKIGEALGVENILEGSVRKFGDQVRITAQLIQVEDGFHLWSESYDRKLENVFAIQDEIAKAILKELKATLLEGEAEVITAKRTDSEAYDLYLLAKQRMYERTRLTLESAAELLDKAIAIDPEYAPAYAQRGIATMLLSNTSYGNIPNDEAQAQAKLYLDKALTLDEDLPEALAGLGLYYQGPPNQPDKAVPVLEKALSINPNLNNAGNWLALSYNAVNRVSDALALLDDITARDPLYKPAIGNRVAALMTLGRSDEARAYLETMKPFFPGDPLIKSLVARIDREEGKAADHVLGMQAALEQQPTNRVFRVGVNRGNYETHQYDLVFDDDWSDYIIWALFNLDHNEEAMLIAQERASEGTVWPLFAFLNANDQSESLVRYFEDRWSSLEEFQKSNPAGSSGYTEMADLALAYRRAGNQGRFDEAMAALASANEQSLTQGVQENQFLMVVAAYHAMAGNTETALEWLAQAIDGGLIVSTQISREYPYFRELDGNPEYEAIQSRMIEHLNRERAQLGLEPVST